MKKTKKWAAAIRSKAAKVVAGVGAMAMAGVAAAQDASLSSTVISELASGKGEVKLVGGAILGIIAVCVLIAMIRRSAR